MIGCKQKAPRPRPERFRDALYEQERDGLVRPAGQVDPKIDLIRETEIIEGGSAQNMAESITFDIRTEREHGRSVCPVRQCQAPLVSACPHAAEYSAAAPLRSDIETPF